MSNYSIQTYNDAEQSENRIHSDEMALRFGFKGALVAGVVVFGHMAYLPVKNGGRDSGTFRKRVSKDVKAYKRKYAFL